MQLVKAAVSRRVFNQYISEYWIRSSIGRYQSFLADHNITPSILRSKVCV